MTYRSAKISKQIANREPLVSVIVPIYNVELYLKKCVDSILNQRYTNLDIILIDDGSPDKSPEICDTYATADKRVRVVHKKNGGLSDARNAGIRIAKGEYLAFIDGDDYIDEIFIETLVVEALKSNADISVCNFQKVYSDRDEIPHRQVDEADFTNISGVRDLFLSPSLCDVMAWNKLYKKELFTANSIFYPVGKIHEDLFTTYKLFYAANKIRFVNLPLYYYVQRDGSIIGQGFSKKSLDAVEAADTAVAWVQLNHLPLQEEVIAYKLAFVIPVLNGMVDQKAIDDGAWANLSQWIVNNKISLLRNKYVPHKNKILIYILCLGKQPYILSRQTFAMLTRG